MADRVPEHFLKGYKIDLDKVRNQFGSWEQDPNNIRFLSLWEKFPAPFLYLATGTEPGGGGCLVIVLADGYDKEALERQPMPVLSEPYTMIFTPGIWVNIDS